MRSGYRSTIVQLALLLMSLPVSDQLAAVEYEAI